MDSPRTITSADICSSAIAPASLYLLHPCSRRQPLLRRLKRLLLELYYRPSMALCNIRIHYIPVDYAGAIAWTRRTQNIS